MNKDLYAAAARALDEASDDYDESRIECGEIPERAGELLEHRLDCRGQRVVWRAFWLEDNDSDLDCALSETIRFCMEHSITAYAIVSRAEQDLVFVVYLTKGDDDDR